MRGVTDDIVGQRFGFLTVLTAIAEHGASWAVCHCECGGLTYTRTSRLKVGKTRSCGCLRGRNRLVVAVPNPSLPPRTRSRRTLVERRLSDIWSTMRARCYNPRHHRWPWYGAKGVSVCDEWAEFGNFYDWAVTAGYVDGLTIDRIDSTGNYEPANCQWITRSENSRRARYKQRYGVEAPARISDIDLANLRSPDA